MVLPEYTAPSIEYPPENDRKPEISETADLEQNANDLPMVIPSNEVTTNRESAPTTRYGRVMKPLQCTVDNVRKRPETRSDIFVKDTSDYNYQCAHDDVPYTCI